MPSNTARPKQHPIYKAIQSAVHALIDLAAFQAVEASLDPNDTSRAPPSFATDPTLPHNRPSEVHATSLSDQVLSQLSVGLGGHNRDLHKIRTKYNMSLEEISKSSPSLPDLYNMLATYQRESPSADKSADESEAEARTVRMQGRYIRDAPIPNLKTLVYFLKILNTAAENVERGGGGRLDFEEFCERVNEGDDEVEGGLKWVGGWLDLCMF